MRNALSSGPFDIQSRHRLEFSIVWSIEITKLLEQSSLNVWVWSAFGIAQAERFIDLCIFEAVEPTSLVVIQMTIPVKLFIQAKKRGYLEDAIPIVTG